MPVFDPQYATIWLLFAGAIAVVLAIRVVARRRRAGGRRPADRGEVRPDTLIRARIVFFLALAALALVIVAAVRRLVQ